ncbi:MAG: translesion error-prone DNA polymerase V autoproteolytic subunit [Flavobacteriaceae bacterium]
MFYQQGIKAGFPSPAGDFDETKISLDQFLIKNKETTFYAKASGTSMIGAGIDDGDIIVIDRSLPAENGKIAVCYIDGDFTVKRISINKNLIQLLPENKNYTPITITRENEFIVWGIVTHVIKSL